MRESHQSFNSEDPKNMPSEDHVLNCWCDRMRVISSSLESQDSVVSHHHWPPRAAGDITQFSFFLSFFLYLGSVNKQRRCFAVMLCCGQLVTMSDECKFSSSLAWVQCLGPNVCKEWSYGHYSNQGQGGAIRYVFSGSHRWSIYTIRKELFHPNSFISSN